MALRATGNTGNRFIELLERRLDNVVFRAGFALSRRHARQLISHGHIKVNGRKVDIPSYLVDLGDEIELVKKELIPQTPILKPPSWIESDLKEGKAKIVRLPERKDLDLKIDETLIVEFYSR
jgi:small subunit ribosomal protein S4